MGNNNRSSTWVLAFLFAVGLIVTYKTVDNFNFVFEFIGRVISAMSPFISGFVIAYLLNLPIRNMQGVLLKTKNRFIKKHVKGISILIIYLAALFLLTVLIRMVVPAVYQNVMDLYYSIPYYFELVIAWITKLQEQFDFNLLNIDPESMLDAIQKFIKNLPLSEIGKYAQGVISVTSGIVGVFISIIISVYMLLDKGRIGSGVKRIMNVFMPKQHVDGALSYIARINDIFSKYIFSVVLDSAIIGVLSTILLSVLGVKYAVILGVLIGVCNLIPYFGAIIAIALSIIVSILTGGWIKGLWSAILLIVLQQIDGNFIGPKIMGNMLKARPLLIIFAVTVGGGLFGVWGMILSVPIAMVLKMIGEDFIKSREEKKADK